MPFQYAGAPQSTVGQTFQRSNEAFGQALMGLLSFMGQKREQQEQQAKVESQQGKAADAWYKSLGEDAEKFTGIPSSAWNNLGAKDQYARMQGVMEAQTTKKVLAQIQEQQRQQAGMAALQNVLKSWGGAGSASPRSAGDILTNPGLIAGPMPAQPRSLDTLLAGFQANPAAVEAPQGMNLLLDAVSRSSAGGKAGAEMKWFKTPAGESYGVDATGQVHFPPGEVAKERGDAAVRVKEALAQGKGSVTDVAQYHALNVRRDNLVKNNITGKLDEEIAKVDADIEALVRKNVQTPRSKTQTKDAGDSDPLGLFSK